MTFIKRLFGRAAKPIEPMHGAVPARNPDTDHAADRGTRERMEAEVAGDRARRDAKEKRPAEVAVAEVAEVAGE